MTTNDIVDISFNILCNPRHFLDVADDMRFPEQSNLHVAVGVATQKPEFLHSSNPGSYIYSR
jgi:hypothetical protein